MTLAAALGAEADNVVVVLVVVVLLEPPPHADNKALAINASGKEERKGNFIVFININKLNEGDLWGHDRGRDVSTDQHGSSGRARGGATKPVRGHARQYRALVRP